MTREEAIEVLLQHSEHWKRLLTENICSKEEGSQTVEALEMAMQALSQEPICDRDCEHCTWMECPIEPCDDAISREAVMRLIENKPYDWSNLTERHEMLQNIRKMPSVTQKSGHWIRWREEVQRGTHYTENIPHCKCSECGTKQDVFASRFIKFCPNCGADMRGAE